MAATQNSYTGNGSTTNYSFTFPYLKASDVKASIDAVDTTAFTLANATTVQFNTAPANGAKIKIFRETGIDSLSATFYAGSAIKSEDLNDNFTQNLYVTQEVNGRYLSSLGGTMVGNLNMGEDASITFEGATDDSNETTLTVADPTAPRTITLPNETGNVVVDTLPDAKIFVGNSSNVVSEVTVTGDIAINNTGVTTIQDNAVETSMIGTDQVTTNEVDSSLVNANIAGTAAIAGTKISPDFGSQNIVTTGSITGGSISTTGTINNLTTTELAILDDATVTTDELNILDGVTANKDELNLLDGALVSTTELNILDGATLSTTELNTLAGITATTTELNYVDGVTSDIQAQIDGKQAADTELTTLAGMQQGTASKLAGSTALTADIADLNQIDGMAKETTITDNDAKFPTSGAVVDYVAAQLAPLGGLEVIATETAFPNTQPSAGVVISISDAGGVVFNGSGTSTTGRTVGGTTVTINNAPSSLNSETLVAGVGLMVSSTGSGQIYNYHKILGKEDDIKQLSDDINDFNARYRVGSSNPTSALDAGDLFFNTGTGKMLVYNGTNTAWEEVQSIGNFFISTLSPAFDGSTQNFTLTNAPSNVQQVLISINGVIQKPNAGTSTPSEGFALDGSTVKFAAAPASGSAYFAVVMGSTVNIGTPSNNTVNTDILQSGAVTNVKVATNAAIAGSKISPSFVNDITITNATPTINFVDSNQDSDFQINVEGGKFTITDTTNSSTRLKIHSGGLFQIQSPTAKCNDLTLEGDLSINTNTPVINLNDQNDDSDFQINNTGGVFTIRDTTNSADRLKVDSSGKVDVAGQLELGGNLKIDKDSPIIQFNDNDDNPDYYIGNVGGVFRIRDTTNNTNRIVVNTDGHVDVTGNLDVGAGVDVTGNVIASGYIGLDANDYVSFTGDTHMDVYVGGYNNLRLLANGDLHAEGDVIAESTTISSDEKLKENIEIVSNPIEKVEALRGVTFDWKRDGNSSAGVIAQDVLKVLPEAVKEVQGLNDDESHLSVNYHALTSILIESVKELSARVKELEAK